MTLRAMCRNCCSMCLRCDFQWKSIYRMEHVILIASMFLLPFKFLVFSHIPLKDCHTSFHCILWHVFQNERRKESLSVPTKSHTKYEKQIRQQIQHEAEWEKSDKRRSKLLGFLHSTHSFTGLTLFPLFSLGSSS